MLDLAAGKIGSVDPWQYAGLADMGLLVSTRDFIGRFTLSSVARVLIAANPELRRRETIGRLGGTP